MPLFELNTSLQWLRILRYSHPTLGQTVTETDKKQIYYETIKRIKIKIVLKFLRMLRSKNNY